MISGSAAGLEISSGRVGKDGRESGGGFRSGHDCVDNCWNVSINVGIEDSTSRSDDDVSRRTKEALVR